MSNRSGPDPKATARTRGRYERLAPIYDLMEILPEQLYIPWRRRLWSLVHGPRVLEIGVGTGKNIPYYPPEQDVVAIDLTPGMLDRARRRSEKLSRDVVLTLGNAQALDFADGSFDTVVASFVFCSVPNPVLGLEEASRVLKEGGQLLLLEHVRSGLPFLGRLMDWLNPLFVNVMGPNINRRTVENVSLAGLVVEEVEELGQGDIFKLIRARKAA